MSVLTATGAVRVRCLSGQSSLPWGPLFGVAPRTPVAALPVAIKDRRGTGSARPSEELPQALTGAASLGAHHGR